MGEAEGRDAGQGRARLALGEEAMDGADPGTTKLRRLDEDLGALSLAFTSRDLREIDEAASQIEVQGARLPPAVLAMSGR